MLKVPSSSEKMMWIKYNQKNLKWNPENCHLGWTLRLLKVTQAPQKAVTFHFRWLNWQLLALWAQELLISGHSQRRSCVLTPLSARSPWSGNICAPRTLMCTKHLAATSSAPRAHAICMSFSVLIRRADPILMYLSFEVHYRQITSIIVPGRCPLICFVLETICASKTNLFVTGLGFKLGLTMPT